MSRSRSTTVYVKRQHDVIADFVVYHRDHGPDCSMWMVPGTQVDAVGARYRSTILAAAKDFSYARQHRYEMEARMNAARLRQQLARATEPKPAKRSLDHHQR